MAVTDSNTNVIAQLGAVVEGLATQLGAVVAFVQLTDAVRRTSREQADAALAFVDTDLQPTDFCGRRC